MKSLTNILLILIAILILGFAGIVIFNIFTPPKPQIPAVNQPIKETIIPEPTITAVEAGLVPPQASSGLMPTQSVPATAPANIESDIVPAQTLKIQFLINKLTSDNIEEALKAEEELVRLGKPALKELVNTLNNLEPTEDVLRPEIAFVLGRFEDKEAVPALITLLDNENSYIRRNAIDSLGSIRGKEAVPALIARLSDEDESVRERTIYALGEIRDYEATDALLERLKDENETEGIKLAAINALAQVKDSRVSQELLKQLKNSPDPFYRNEVVDSLVNIGNKQAIPELTEYLNQLKNNKPEDSGDIFSWQESIIIAENAVQRLGD